MGHKPQRQESAAHMDPLQPMQVTVDGKLNMFGKGSKTSAFSLGERVIAISKSSHSPMPSCIEIHKHALERNRRRDKAATYHMQVVTAPLANLLQRISNWGRSEYEQKANETILREFSSKSSFTLFIVSDLISDMHKMKILMRGEAPSIAEALRHNYFCYLMPEFNNLPSTFDIQIRYVQPEIGSLHSMHLASGGIECCLDRVHRLHKDGKARRMEFSIQVWRRTYSADVTEPEPVQDIGMVRCVLWYLPFLDDRELRDEVAWGSSTFQAFWKGRRMAKVELDHLWFNLPETLKGAKLEDKEHVQRRVVGALFLGSTRLTDDVKSDIVGNLRIYLQDTKNYDYEVYMVKGSPSGAPTGRRKKLLTKEFHDLYVEWLAQCHAQLDQSVSLEDYDPESKTYRTMYLRNTRFAAGDMVWCSPQEGITEMKRSSIQSAKVNLKGMLLRLQGFVLPHADVDPGSTSPRTSEPLARWVGKVCTVRALREPVRLYPTQEVWRIPASRLTSKGPLSTAEVTKYKKKEEQGAPTSVFVQWEAPVPEMTSKNVFNVRMDQLGRCKLNATVLNHFNDTLVDWTSNNPKNPTKCAPIELVALLESEGGATTRGAGFTPLPDAHQPKVMWNEVLGYHAIEFFDVVGPLSKGKLGTFRLTLSLPQFPEVQACTMKLRIKAGPVAKLVAALPESPLSLSLDNLDLPDLVVQFADQAGNQCLISGLEARGSPPRRRGGGSGAAAAGGTPTAAVRLGLEVVNSRSGEAIPGIRVCAPWDTEQPHTAPGRQAVLGGRGMELICSGIKLEAVNAEAENALTFGRDGLRCALRVRVPQLEPVDVKLVVQPGAPRQLRLVGALSEDEEGQSLPVPVLNRQFLIPEGELQVLDAWGYEPPNLQKWQVTIIGTSSLKLRFRRPVHGGRGGRRNQTSNGAHDDTWRAEVSLTMDRRGAVNLGNLQALVPADRFERGPCNVAVVMSAAPVEADASRREMLQLQHEVQVMPSDDPAVVEATLTCLETGDIWTVRSDDLRTQTVTLPACSRLAPLLAISDEALQTVPLKHLKVAVNGEDLTASDLALFQEAGVLPDIEVPRQGDRPCVLEVRGQDSSEKVAASFVVRAAAAAPAVLALESSTMSGASISITNGASLAEAGVRVWVRDAFSNTVTNRDTLRGLQLELTLSSVDAAQVPALVPGDAQQAGQSAEAQEAWSTSDGGKIAVPLELQRDGSFSSKHIGLVGVASSHKFNLNVRVVGQHDAADEGDGQGAEQEEQEAATTANGGAEVQDDAKPAVLEPISRLAVLSLGRPVALALRNSADWASLCRAPVSLEHLDVQVVDSGGNPVPIKGGASQLCKASLVQLEVLTSGSPARTLEIYAGPRSMKRKVKATEPEFAASKALCFTGHPKWGNFCRSSSFWLGNGEPGTTYQCRIAPTKLLAEFLPADSHMGSIKPLVFDTQMDPLLDQVVRIHAQNRTQQVVSVGELPPRIVFDIQVSSAGADPDVDEDEEIDDTMISSSSFDLSDILPGFSASLVGPDQASSEAIVRLGEDGTVVVQHATPVTLAGEYHFVVRFQDPRDEVLRFVPPRQERAMLGATGEFAVKPGPPHQLIVATVQIGGETDYLVMGHRKPRLKLARHVSNDPPEACLLCADSDAAPAATNVPVEIRIFAADQFGNPSWNEEQGQGRLLTIQAKPQGHANDPVIEIHDPGLAIPGAEFQAVDDSADLLLQLGTEDSKFLSWPAQDHATAQIRIRPGSGRHPRCESQPYELEFCSDGLTPATVEFRVFDAQGRSEAQRTQREEYERQRREARSNAQEAEFKRRKLADAAAKCRSARDAARRDAMQLSGEQVSNLDQLEDVLKAKIHQSRRTRQRHLPNMVERGLATAKEALSRRREDAFIGAVADLFQTRATEQPSIDDKLAEVISWHIGSRMEMLLVKDEAAANTVHNVANHLRVRPLGASRHKDFEFPPLKLATGQWKFRSWFAAQVLETTPAALRAAAHHPTIAASALSALLWDLVRDTMVVETREDARAYRTAVVEKQKNKCPTILTLDGHRILANGERGGVSNTLPRGMDGRAVFGARQVDARRLNDALDMIAEHRDRERELKAVNHDLEQQERHARDLEAKVVQIECALLHTEQKGL
uniref:Uncharacterized protein n=1 Tax=Rhizochromulina marina TaxID=1034831 RepID=A0A7S2WP39_9STRA